VIDRFVGRETVAAICQGNVNGEGEQQDASRDIIRRQEAPVAGDGWFHASLPGFPPIDGSLSQIARER
jgi:hypothetical protein